MATVVDIEIGAKKVFVWAVDWPGWCRSGRTEEAALAALADYVPRYAVVAAEARVRYPKSAGDTLEIRERLPGNASTEFGIPGQVSAGDAEPVQAAEATRAGKLLTAAWSVLDAVAAVTPAELRKGPRGGGRDRDKMLGHVVEAEAGYARMIGVKQKPPPFDDAEAVAALRAEILAVLAKPSDGAPLRPKGWPARYAARRIAWHVLDHVWEMQDRSPS
ncbi:DinB family protein [Phytohabitans rumicis]|uniref:DinB-like domain-containing protein n=1 Tax=Phytohabitans rumicis TaxID=1076125 RepID=A0A6V8LKT0_9ACTN|nr:DinB family protein [Phytohabitans rumicis]GFJ94766.1 hypothetical protein Prum_084080 [Phytohabitans rumicis]